MGFELDNCGVFKYQGSLRHRYGIYYPVSVSAGDQQG